MKKTLRYNYRLNPSAELDVAGLIRELKGFEEFSWLKAFDSAAAQQVARGLDVALKNAISKGRIQRFPKHKVTFKQKKLPLTALDALITQIVFALKTAQSVSQK